MLTFCIFCWPFVYYWKRHANFTLNDVEWWKFMKKHVKFRNLTNDEWRRMMFVMFYSTSNDVIWHHLTWRVIHDEFRRKSFLSTNNDWIWRLMSIFNVLNFFKKMTKCDILAKLVDVIFHILNSLTSFDVKLRHISSVNVKRRHVTSKII